MTSTYFQLVKDFQQRAFVNLYLFYGEEPYYIDELSDYLTEHVLNELEKQFNQVVMYGRDSSAALVVNSSKQFPMVGERQLVVLREAQDMDMKKEENLNLLLSYINHPQQSTILVICHKYKAPPAKLLKALVASENAVTIESKRKYENEMPAWITTQVKNSGYTISDKAANMLVEYLGNNLEKINNELGKLYINHPKNKVITEDVIELYIGISKDYNIFEFQKALAKKNVLKANQIAHHFALNPNENPLFRTIPMLFSFFSKVLLIHSLPDKSEASILSKAKLSSFNKHDYFDAYRNYPADKIQDIIGWLRECNVRAIGIDNYSTDQGELLRELVFKIIH
ncbi:MAG: DNA polymerase III subunit delta [Lentimicrobiaceae bacterium]|jgi:DNA polymerase-3 subunit delta